MRMQIVVSSVALLLLTAVSASALPFQNGDFEATSCFPPAPGFSTLAVGETCITGWTVVQSNIDYLHDYWQDAEATGDKSLDLNGNAGAGGIQQVFDTISGDVYSVMFSLAGNPEGGPTVKSLIVSAAGISVPYTFDTTGKSKTDMGWTSLPFFFMANSNSTTLQFLSTTDGLYYGPALDNVSVDLVTDGSAVPEPASLTLLGTGLLGLVRARRRQRS